MLIRGQELDVDIRAELYDFEDRFDIIKERGEKFIASSPFREERHPSFAVNLETGVYIDSGSVDDDWKKGNFIQLLSFLRCETYEDTINYLLDKYGLLLDKTDQLFLDINLTVKVNNKVYPLEALKPFLFKSNYLSNRNVSEKVQKAFKTGYDPSSNAIVLPIMDTNSNIVSFKFRTVKGKIFWYDKEGQLIKQHLYGMHFVHKMKCTEVYIVEGEIDCLYLWSLGIPAIATFGASLSTRQEMLILQSPIEHLVIATDNDNVGRKFSENLEERFMSTLEVSQLKLPSHYKDVNSIPLDEIYLLKNVFRSIPSFI